MLATINKNATTCRVYTRVSTQKQGVSGLGLEAQQNIAIAKAQELGLEVIEECKEVESGRKTQLGRPVLRKALEDCKEDGAVLIVAKMDRLTRNFSFLSKLAEAAERDGIGIVAADVPSMGSPWQTKMMWRILASVAEAEREAAVERTTAAMAIAKKRGTKLGNPSIAKAQNKGTKATKQNTEDFARKIFPFIEEIKAAGITSLRGIARALNARGIKTYQAEVKDEGTSRRQEGRRVPQWQAEQVRKIINRINLNATAPSAI